MKKAIIGILIIFITLMTFTYSVSYATATTNELITEQTNDIQKMKDKATAEIEEFKTKYNSDTYGMTAFILNKVRFYSIPVCFMGIVVGLLFQFVLGTRRLDKKHKGFNLILMFTTLLVICQVLPLIFAVVVTNWRG